jgi:hypothetical protein
MERKGTTLTVDTTVLPNKEQQSRDDLNHKIK